MTRQKVESIGRVEWGYHVVVLYKLRYTIVVLLLLLPFTSADGDDIVDQLADAVEAF